MKYRVRRFEILSFESVVEAKDKAEAIEIAKDGNTPYIMDVCMPFLEPEVEELVDEEYEYDNPIEPLW